jgi:hypothetical protein
MLFRKYLSHIPGKQEIKKFGERNFIGLCTHTSENTKVEVQYIQHGK